MADKGITAAGQRNWNQMVTSLPTKPPKGKVPALDKQTSNRWGAGLRGLTDQQVDQTMQNTFTWYRNHANRYGFVDDKSRNDDHHDQFRKEAGELYQMYQQFKPNGISTNERLNLTVAAGQLPGGADRALLQMLRTGNGMLDRGQAQLSD